MSKIDLNVAGQAEQARIERGRDTQRTAEQSATVQSAPASREPDKVNLSERAAEVTKLAARVAELPDVRQERVEELRRLVSSGEYNPPAEAIANAILKDEG